MPIAHPGLYDAVYSALRGMQAEIPLKALPPALHVFRSGDADDAGPAGAEKYRTVYKSSTNDAYRWTGPRVQARVVDKTPAAGVYTSLGFNDALLGEFAFAAFDTSLDADVRRRVANIPKNPVVLDPSTFSPALATKRIFEYAVTPSLLFVDFSLSGRAGREFIRSLDALPAVAAELRAAGFHNTRSAYCASKDHSVPRAMGQAVRDFLPRCRVMRVSSVRAQSAIANHDEQIGRAHV